MTSLTDLKGSSAAERPLSCQGQTASTALDEQQTKVAGVRLRAPEQAPAETQAAGSSGAVYRATPADAWQDCEIIGYTPDGAVLREVGKVWPGVWVAPLDRVRVTTGLVLEIQRTA